jgi:FtsP/CotA-like multicopper oxidase with cupredoxin domain
MTTRRRFLALSAAMAAMTARPVVGRDEVVLTAVPLRAGLDGGPLNDFLSYDGMVPGPLLRLPRGRETVIRYVNTLDEPTTVHWHGLRIANAMDGVPGLTQRPVMPGEEFTYRLTPPDAGTFWYHAHVSSWSQVARGLLGPLVVEDDAPAYAPEADHVLVLTDWRLRPGGAFDSASLGSAMDWAHAGRIGNFLTVNGLAEPTLALAPGANRLRLINSSTARVLNLAYPGAWVIARDGQALAKPLPMPEKLVLGPAQRIDLAVTGPGVLDEVTLKPIALARFTGGSAARLPDLAPPAIAAPGAGPILPFRLVMEGGALGRLGGRELGDMHDLTGGKAGAQPLWALNGVSGMGGPPVFDVARGTGVALTMLNDTAWDHAIHFHGHHVQVVRRNGAETGDAAWLDTVMSAPGESLEVRFVADNPGDWMIHCHMLEHSAGGMDGWFRVS